jgi:predicted restriction endonuclease
MPDQVSGATVRNDTELVQALKELCEFRCQFPGCGKQIRKKDGSFYIEVAHVKPVAKGGTGILGNVVVLCPNHHKEFDYGDLQFIEQTEELLHGKLNGVEFRISLPRPRS